MRKFVLAGAVIGSALAMWAGFGGCGTTPDSQLSGRRGVARGAVRPWNGRLPHPPASG